MTPVRILIRHDHRGHAAKVLNASRATLNEIDAALSERGLGVGIRGAEHGDEKFRRRLIPIDYPSAEGCATMPRSWICATYLE